MEARSRAEVRRQSLKPYYDALRDASTEEEVFPEFDLFTNMPAVRALWEDEDSTIDENVWNASFDEIQAQLPKVARWIQLEYARALLKAYKIVGRPVEDELTLSIHPRDPVSLPEAYKIDGYRHETALDIDDPSTISSTDLDAFLSRFTAAVFKKPDYRQLLPLHWKKAYEGRSLEHGLDFEHDLNDVVSQYWLRTLFKLLELTGIDDDESAEKELDQLGEKFWCQECPPSILSMSSDSKATRLTWKEMVSTLNFPLSSNRVRTG